MSVPEIAFSIERVPVYQGPSQLSDWTVVPGWHRSYVDRRIVAARVRYLKRNKTLVTCLRALKKVSKKKRASILQELSSMFGVREVNENG